MKRSKWLSLSQAPLRLLSILFPDLMFVLTLSFLPWLRNSNYIAVSVSLSFLQTQRELLFLSHCFWLCCLPLIEFCWICWLEPLESCQNSFSVNIFSISWKVNNGCYFLCCLVKSVDRNLLDFAIFKVSQWRILRFISGAFRWLSIFSF